MFYTPISKWDCLLFALIFTVLRASNAFQDSALKEDITGGSMSMKGRVNQMSGK